MQNGKQIDLSAQVERVKRKTRPWKSIIALLLAIAAAVISHRARHGRATFLNTSDLTNQFVIYGTAVLFLVFGSTATYGLAGKSRELLEPKAGPAHAAIVRYAILIVGAFTTLVITLVLFGVTSASSSSAGRSPPSSSASRPSRRSATSSPGWCWSSPGRSRWVTRSGCAPARSAARSTAS